MDKSFELRRWLIVYGAAAFQAYHTGRAFHVYDPEGWHFANVNIGGLILGAIVNLVIAQAALKLPSMSATFSSLKELLPKASKKADKKEMLARSRALKKMTLARVQNFYSQFGFYSLLSISALMVAPALYILWSARLDFPWWFVMVMAGVGAVAPDLAITVGGFISGGEEQSHSVAPAKASADSDTDAPAPAKGTNRTPKKSEVPAPEMRACDLGCGISYRWPQGKGGHMKEHHPELCVVKGMPAGTVIRLKEQSKTN